MTPSLTSTPLLTASDAAQLLHEHQVLLRQHAAAQTRCSALVTQQAAALVALEAQTLRLRAAVIVRDSALACAREGLMALQPRAAAAHAGDTSALEDLAGLEASLVAADLVICQTGCLSHGAYWRVQDLCARTGKACVLVGTSDALRIVRIHKPHAGVAQAVQLAPDDRDGQRPATCLGVR